MTFIASVVAKKGVALIADSLATAIQPIIEFEDFLEYKKSKEERKVNFQMEMDEVVKLFKAKATHTKDYEEKLFEYDTYTAIAVAGNALINDKRIADIVSEIRENNHNRNNRKGYNTKSVETKVKDFCTYFVKEIKEHLKKKDRVGMTSFIFTNYNPVIRKTVIYKIDISQATKEALKDENYQYITYNEQIEPYKVICEGQNRISERILFGDINTIEASIPKIINAVLDNLRIDKQMLTQERYSKIVTDSGVINSAFWDDVKIFQLPELSLQQAVDLACLLMRIEMDFQKYTKNIPTVGGVIKLAVIDDKGFRYIHGYNIVKPGLI